MRVLFQSVNQVHAVPGDVEWLMPLAIEPMGGDLGEI